MGSGFIRPDAGLVSKIQRLTDAGAEFAVLSHSFKQGEGQAMEKLEKLGLKGVIPEHNIFGQKRFLPIKKARTRRFLRKRLRPSTTCATRRTRSSRARQSWQKIRSATCGVPRKQACKPFGYRAGTKTCPIMPRRSYRKSSRQSIISTLRRINFWTRWMLRSVLPKKTCKGGVARGAGVTLSGRSQSRSHSP